MVEPPSEIITGLDSATVAVYAVAVAVAVVVGSVVAVAVVVGR